MFTKIDLMEATGKRIRSIVNFNDEGVIISFTDDTFSVVAAEMWREDPEIDTNPAFDASNFRLDLYLEPAFGEHARPMFDAAIRKKEQLQAEQNERHAEARRKKYEELKAEFGDDA